jgi:hypothetical protein
MPSWESGSLDRPRKRAREKAIRGTARDTQLAFWRGHACRVGEILRGRRENFRGKLLTQLDVVVELEETFGVPASPAWLSLLERGESRVPPSAGEVLALGLCLEFLDAPEFQELESRLHYVLLPPDVDERAEVLQTFERIRQLPSDCPDRCETMRDLYQLLMDYRM